MGTGKVAVELSVGDRAPEFTLMDIHGQAVSLSDYGGKVVLLDFWATWCAPCVGLMPFYETLQTEDHGFEFTILTVNLESMNKAKQFLDAKGHSLRTVVDSDKQVMVQYGVRAIPDAVLIDADGVIRSRIVGWGQKSRLRHHLAKERIRRFMVAEEGTRS